MPGSSRRVVVSLVVVHVHAVAVDVLAEAVAGPMNEQRAEAGPLDDRAAGAVDLEAAELAAVARR